MLRRSCPTSDVEVGPYLSVPPETSNAGSDDDDDDDDDFARR